MVPKYCFRVFVHVKLANNKQEIHEHSFDHLNDATKARDEYMRRQHTKKCVLVMVLDETDKWL